MSDVSRRSVSLSYTESNADFETLFQSSTEVNADRHTPDEEIAKQLNRWISIISPNIQVIVKSKK